MTSRTPWCIKFFTVQSIIVGCNSYCHISWKETSHTCTPGNKKVAEDFKRAVTNEYQDFGRSCVQQSSARHQNSWDQIPLFKSCVRQAGFFFFFSFRVTLVFMLDCSAICWCFCFKHQFPELCHLLDRTLWQPGAAKTVFLRFTLQIFQSNSILLKWFHY